MVEGDGTRAPREAVNLVRSGKSYRLQVVNPFYGPIMAGRVWGLFEASSEESLVLGEREDYEDMNILELSVG